MGLTDTLGIHSEWTDARTFVRHSALVEDLHSLAAVPATLSRPSPHRLAFSCAAAELGKALGWVRACSEACRGRRNTPGSIESSDSWMLEGCHSQHADHKHNQLVHTQHGCMQMASQGKWLAGVQCIISSLQLEAEESEHTGLHSGSGTLSHPHDRCSCSGTEYFGRKLRLPHTVQVAPAGMRMSLTTCLVTG